MGKEARYEFRVFRVFQNTGMEERKGKINLYIRIWYISAKRSKKSKMSLKCNFLALDARP